MESLRKQLGGSLGIVFELLILSIGASNTTDMQNVTSANPSWQIALWHLIAVAIWLPGLLATSDQVAAAARAAVGDFKKPPTVQASYLNKAHPDEVDWQSAFFSANYDKLLAIKQKHDPVTVLNYRAGVGYLGDEDPMYSCSSEKLVPSTPYLFN